MPGALELVRANHSARVDKMTELREIDERCTADDRAYTDEEQAQITELRTQLAAIDDRLTAALELESRNEQITQAATGLDKLLADRDAAEARAKAPDTRSIGERYAEARGDTFDSAERFLAEGMEMRAVLDTGDFLVQPDRAPGVVGPLDQRTYLADLLPRQATGSNSLEYVQDNTDYSTNPAAEVAEGAAKPEGGLSLTEVTDPVRTIAVWTQMTRQAAEDASEVAAYLDGRLRYQLRRRLDASILAGNGTSPNLLGILNRSGILTQAPSSAEDQAITIRKAQTTMEQADSVPQIVVLNPADAEAFDLTNYAASGLNAVPNVAGPSARTAWGLTQVRMPQIASGTALLIDPISVMVRDRQQPTVHWTDSHASTFTSNILTLLLELRAGLQVFQPKGICKVTFNVT